MRSASMVLVTVVGLAFCTAYATGAPSSGACPDKPDQTIGSDFMSQADLTCYQAPRIVLRCGNRLYDGRHGTARHDLRPQYSQSVQFRDWDRSVPLSFFVSCEPAPVVRVSVRSWTPKPPCCGTSKRYPDDAEAAACCQSWANDPTVEVASLETWDGSTYPWPEDLPPGDYAVDVLVVTEAVTNPFGVSETWDSRYSFLIRLSPGRESSVPTPSEAPTCYAVTLSGWTSVDEDGRTTQVTPEPSWLVPSRLRLDLTGPTADEWRIGGEPRLAVRPDGVAVAHDHFRVGTWDLTDDGEVMMMWSLGDDNITLHLDSPGETTHGKLTVGTGFLPDEPTSDVFATRVPCRATSSPR